MSARNVGITLCALSAASFYLWAAPALSGISSPTPKVGAIAQSQSAPWQAKSGQIASGYPAASEAFRQLTAEWWQWVLSIPTAENPLLDLTGADCVVGQRGPVRFLVGNFGGGTTTRDCTVPEGKLLFFPVINSVNIDTPNVCGQGPERIPVADLRALSRAFINGAVNLSVVLDGKPLSKLSRTRSKVFEISLPEENIFDAPCATLGGVPAGVYSPAVDVGVYTLIKDIKKGEHTLTFHAENPSQGFVSDITYHLTVVSVKLH